MDYTAIPVGWVLVVCVLVKEHIQKEAASKLVNSFMMVGHRALNRPGLFAEHLSAEVEHRWKTQLSEL